MQSLLTAELARNSRSRTERLNGLAAEGAWPESLVMGDDGASALGGGGASALGCGGASALGCDSLDRLWLAAAVNEMFCLYDAQVEDSLLGARTFGDWLDIVDVGWNNGGQRLTFSTSGSSGPPRRCTHDLAHLQREVHFLAERFAEVKRVVALAPAHHIYGFLFTAMLPTVMDVPVLDANGLPPGVLLRELRAGDGITSFPTRWEWLARSIPEWPKGVHGITSTAPCPEALKRVLVGGGITSFTEIYGSSETAGVGVRSFPETRYTLMSHLWWAKRAEGDAEAGALLQDCDGKRIPLQDQVDVSADGTFAVAGRLDGAVQVGGVNVYPRRLEEQLRAIPGVAEAAVRLCAEGRGDRLKAFVVPNERVTETELAETLEAWTQTLPAPERVRAFTFGTALPRTSMGKVADWETGPATAV